MGSSSREQFRPMIECPGCGTTEDRDGYFCRLCFALLMKEVGFDDPTIHAVFYYRKNKEEKKKAS
jgi:hypothetical protein